MKASIRLSDETFELPGPWVKGCGPRARYAEIVNETGEVLDQGWAIVKDGKVTEFIPCHSCKRS